MFFVYILFSDSIAKFYVGQTNNIEERLFRHNSGFVKSTKLGLPWNLVRFFEVSTRSEAMLLEKKIKGRGVKRYLEDFDN
jgi:putative endonuclease